MRSSPCRAAWARSRSWQRSWAQLGLHAKPIGLLGVADYWADLLRWLDGALTAGFVAPAYRALITEAADLASLLEAFERR
jgi:predicted Rossmann-fold nucleotide-binding protein